jgi:thermitase
MIPAISKASLMKRATISTLAVALILTILIPAFGSTLRANSSLSGAEDNVKPNGASVLQGIWTSAGSEKANSESCASLSSKGLDGLDIGVSGFVVGLDNASAEDLSELERITDGHGGRIVDFVSVREEPKAAVVELPQVAASACLEEMQSKNFSYVEPRMKMKAQFVPNDPYWSNQWGLQKIQADWAWNTTLASHNVLVAVVDTGVDYHHPDLVGNYVALGYDWVNGDADPMDDTGHGTHCAGIIAATINNSVGIAGLAQVRIMAEKVLDSQGEGYSDWIADGIIHAADQGANIISMSFGDYENSRVIYEAIKYAHNAGVLLVAAAGNYNSDLEFYPASYDEVVAVTATDANDTKASFSDFGNWVELAAPGVDVFSTYLNNDYEKLSGTSMACPHVSGLAALVMSAYPNMTADFVRLLLRYTADDLGAPSFDPYYGYGRINARNALNSPSVDHQLVAYRLETPPYLKLGVTNTMAAKIFNFGKSEEHGFSVQLLANNSVVWSHVVDSLASYSVASVDAEWAPTHDGTYNITLYVVPLPGEENVGDNVLTKSVYAGSPVKAVVVRSSGNTDEEVLKNWNVLNNHWEMFGSRMVYVDYLSLKKDDITYQDIASSEADVLIVSSADEVEYKNSELDAMERYVREGHGLVVTGDSFNKNAPNNERLAELVGLRRDLNLHWFFNGTDLVEIINATHPIFEKVANPIVLPPVSTVVPFNGQWGSEELAGGKCIASGYSNESVIVEFNGLLYFSFKLETVPPQYQHHLQLLYNAIMWSRYMKPQHDLTVLLDCPRYISPMGTAFLNATVENMGWENEINVQISLTIDGSLVNTTTIAELLSSSSYTINYLWQTDREASHDITAYAPAGEGEDHVSDNTKSRAVSVHYPRFVLWDNTHGSPGGLHEDDYLSLQRLLASEGFVVHDLEDRTISDELLLGYDILVLPDSATDFSPSEVSDILEWITEGGSVFVIVGNGFTGTLRLLTVPYGVQIFRDVSDQGMTDNVIPHPVTREVSLLYYADAQRLEVKAPSQVLASTATGSADNVSSSTFDLLTATENKEMVILSSNYMFDNAGICRADNEQLAMNLFHWFAINHFREHDTALALETPSFVQRGETVQLNTTVRNLGSTDEIGVEARMLINDTVVESVTISTLPSGCLYVFNHSWTPIANGNYNVTAYVSPVPGEDFTANNLIANVVPVSFYERYYFPSRWLSVGNPMGWHADDDCWTFTLPFSFPFYDSYYQTIYASSNGLITFLGMDGSHNASIKALSGKLAIAPAWHDWTTADPYDIYVDRPDATYVTIRWEACDDSSATANFAVKLGQDGVIQLFYGYCNQSVSAVIGISDGAGHILAENVTSLNHIHTVVFAPFQIEHEVVASVEAPVFVSLGAPTVLNATVFNLGLINETDVSLWLMVNGSVVCSTLVSELNTGSYKSVSWVWNSTEAGEYSVTAYVSPVPGEIYTDDNWDTKTVYVSASTVTYVSVDPQMIDAKVGSVLVLSMEVNNVESLHAWQVTLYYNSTILKCIEAWFPTDNVFAGKQAMFPEPALEVNYTMVGATLFGSDSVLAGRAVLFKMKFQVNSPGNSMLMLNATDTFLLDPLLKFINCTLVRGIVEATLPDFNNDGKVDTSDLTTIANAFRSQPSNEKWNPVCDVNHDSRIDILDVAVVAKAFGKSVNA